MGCDGGVLNENALCLAFLERAVSGEEWPGRPVNIYLTCGHSGDLQGDAHLLSKPLGSGPLQVGPAHTPPGSPHRNINLDCP